MKIFRNRLPLPFLFLAFLTLLAALWAGLLRLGWSLPKLTPMFAIVHGPLMVSGFLGILITLERAVALKQKWMYAAPLFAGLGGLGMIVIPASLLGPVLLTLGSLGGVAILIEIVRREAALHTLTMLLGTVAWFTGNLLWMSGWQIFQAIFFWQAFLVLTIAGERIELSRVLRPSHEQKLLFGVVIGGFLGGVVVSLFDLSLSSRLTGGSLLLLAGWSVQNDLAWRNLRHKLPLTRYIAWCLVLGFVWLGIGGGLHLIFGAQAAGPRYDAALHAIFIGFVMSMIFGHAPIIFPAVLGVAINFRSGFYFPLVLLHGSLALRILADYASWHVMRMWGGLLNVIAILLFLVLVASSVRSGHSGK